jgi:hypothetical protein
LEDHRQEGLTDKNIAFLRQVLTPGVWERVLKLPFTMMAEARRQQAHGSVRAGVTAQLAVAIAVLSVAPIRLQNLTAIRLGTNLIKPDGPNSNYWLNFPDYDVKNRVRLDFPLEQYLTRLIDEYVRDFRPTLLRGRNEDYLFPGQREGAKGKMLAHCPMRIKNFATLEIGRTFKQVQDSWWIALPRQSTKTKRFDERRVPEILNDAIDVYLEQSRPDLRGSREPTDFLWISSRTGRRMTTKNLGTLISKITYRTLGVDVSPHLFRTAAATTAAMYGGNTPHLASAVLGHTDSRVTEEHYTRATSIEAAKTYAAIIRRYLST